MTEEKRLQQQHDQLSTSLSTFSAQATRSFQDVLAAVEAGDVEAVRRHRDVQDMPVAAMNSTANALHIVQARQQFLMTHAISSAMLSVARSQKQASWRAVLVAVLAMVVTSGAAILARY